MLRQSDNREESGQVFIETIVASGFLILAFVSVLLFLFEMWAHTQISFHCRQSLRNSVLTHRRPDQWPAQFVCSDLTQRLRFGPLHSFSAQNCKLSQSHQEISLQTVISSRLLPDRTVTCNYVKPEGV